MTPRFGHEQLWLPSCHSTNDIAAEKARQGAAEGLLVFCGEQTAGRGQQGSTWQSEPNANFTGSFVARPVFLGPDKAFWLSKVVALALRSTVQDYIPTPALIKWPNDIWVRGRKLGGILIENTVAGARLETSIWGIGCNIGQRDFPEGIKATSLVRHGADVSVATFAERLGERLSFYYARLWRGDYQSLDEDYHAQLLGLGEPRLYYRPDGSPLPGTLLGVEESGHLRLATDAGVERFALKELVWGE